MKATAILLAAGSGTRMAAAVADKVLEPLGGRPVFIHAVDALLASGAVSGLRLVVRDAAQRHAIAAALEAHGFAGAPIDWVDGGPRRQDSVLNALEAGSGAGGPALVHDAARPLVRAADIAAVVTAVSDDGGAALARPVTDTIKRAAKPGPVVGALLEDLERDRLWAMETPQAFPWEPIREAYRAATAAGLTLTDDVAAARHAGMPVTLVRATAPNPKLTTPDDLDYLNWLLESRRPGTAG